MTKRPWFSSQRNQVYSGVLCALLLLPAVDVSAQPSDAPTQAELARAQQLYQSAERNFTARRYAVAYEQMKEAYRLSRLADLLFNLGKISAQMGRRRDAIAHLEMYLRVRPEAPDRTEVQQQLDALHKKVKEEEVLVDAVGTAGPAQGSGPPEQRDPSGPTTGSAAGEAAAVGPRAAAGEAAAVGPRAAAGGTAAGGPRAAADQRGAAGAAAAGTPDGVGRGAAGPGAPEPGVVVAHREGAAGHTGAVSPALRARVSWPALGVAGGGAVLLIIGAALGGAAVSAAHSVAGQADQRNPQVFDTGLQATQARGQALQAGGIALDVLGLLTLAAGGTWAGYHYYERRHQGRARVALLPLGLGAQFTGSF